MQNPNSRSRRFRRNSQAPAMQLTERDVEIIRQVQREIFKMSDLTPEQKADLGNVIGEYDYRLTQGANSDIQLSALLAQFAKFGKNVEETYAAK